MGFAEAWTHAACAPFQPPTPKDKLDTMDTIRPGGHSVHTVHIVPKVSPPVSDPDPLGSIFSQSSQLKPERYSEDSGNIENRGSYPGAGNSEDSENIEFRVPSQAYETGLGWLPGPPDDADPAFPSWWAALDLQDIGRCFGVRIVRAGERVLAVYPPGLAADLVDAASEVLAEARPYLAANLDKLPTLTPAEAVVEIKAIMRQHKGLRFTRGGGGSMWPLYPRTWTASQKATVQALWFAAGDALDADSFMEVDR